MTPQEKLLAHVQDWAPRFLEGRTKDRALLRPELREGERFGTKVNSIGLSRVSAHDPLGTLDRGAPPIGIAYGTSERLIIANGGRIKHSWEWSELAEVVVLQGYSGVLLSTDSDTADAVHYVDLRRDPFAPPPYRTGARWVQLEGCFQASRGQLHTWLERLPGRVLV